MKQTLMAVGAHADDIDSVFISKSEGGLILKDGDNIK